MNPYKSILILTFLLLFISSTGYANTKAFIIDQTDILSDLERENLNNLLSSYEKRTSVELVGMIVNSLDGEDIFDYSMRICNELEIGKTDVNNGGFILIAIQEKQIRINLAYGLEWPVSDVHADFIIYELIPFLKKNNYYEALNLGFTRLIELTSKYSWAIEDKNIELLDFTDIGKIFSFKGKFLKEILQESKVNADGSFEIQLKPWDQFIVTSNNQKELIINATNHMKGMVRFLKENESCRIVARLVNLEPLTFELMSITASK